MGSIATFVTSSWTTRARVAALVTAALVAAAFAAPELPLAAGDWW